MKREPSLRRSGRLAWKLALLLVVVLGAVVFLGPALAAPFVRDKVVQGLDENLQARASLDELRFDLAGRVHAVGFALEEPDGRPFLRLESLDLDAGILDAVRGRWSASVSAYGFELHLRQDEEGRWNYESIAGGESESDDPGEPGEAPSVSARVELTRGRVVVHGAEEQTSFEDLELRFELADLSEPAGFHLKGRVEGPEGSGGTVSAQGVFVGSSDGKLGPASFTADVSAVIGELSLAAFQPVAGLTSPVTELSGVTRGTLDVTVETGMRVNGEWELSIDDLEIATGDEGYGPANAKRISVSGTAQSSEDGIVLATGVVAEELHVEAPDPDSPSVNEPKLELKLHTGIAPGTLDVTLHDLSVRSRLARGNMTGVIRGAITFADEQPQLVLEDLKGEVTYVPDQVGVLLGPMLPGKLSGSEEETMAFRLSGTPEALDPLSILASTNATASMGLGTFTAQGIQATGGVDVEVENGLATFRGDLGANGGGLSLEASLGLGPRSSEGARATFQMKDVGATSGLAPLLELMHPAFGGLGDRLGGDSVTGLFSGKLEVSYDAPLAGLLGGDEDAALDLSAISGSGSFSMDQALLSGSPLLGLLFSELGAGSKKELKVKPIDFRIDGGRLRYEKPWTWNLSGSETEFRGSIGLDRTLDMTWNVPVTEKLIAKNDFLESLAGQTLTIPLKGTVKKPRLEWNGVLEEIAESALRKELEKELGLDDLTKQLGGLLGQPQGAGPGAGAEQVESAESLFTEANRLWKEGKKKKAAVLYGRIRSEFKLSPIYFLNRKVIKKRAAYEG